MGKPNQWTSPRKSTVPMRTRNEVRCGKCFKKYDTKDFSDCPTCNHPDKVRK